MDITTVTNVTYLGVIGIGLIAGAHHVVAGPDHLAAVAPVAAHQPRKAGWIGVTWGFGHGLGAALIGCLALLLRGIFDVTVLTEWSEFLVGFMLIGIGLWAMRTATRTVIHSHQHEHDGSAHQHIHVHAPDHAHEPEPGAEGADEAPVTHRHGHASMGIGMLHGAAGTGHLLAVVPALTWPVGQALVYLACYFLAAVASMGLFGLFLGLLTRGGAAWKVKGMMYASSLAAVVIGCVWIVTAWPGAGGA